MASKKWGIVALAGLLASGYAIYKGINKEPAKYSIEWIKSLSDEQWEIERELVQNKYRNPEYNTEYRTMLKRVLDLFDKIKSDRYSAGRTPQGPSYSREHGYNLYKSD